MNWIVLYLCLNLSSYNNFSYIYVHLTAVHDMRLAKVYLTHGLTITWNIARSRCLWLMDLVTVQTIRIFPNYCVAWMLHLLVRLAVQYFIIRIFAKWWWQAQSAKEVLFRKCNNGKILWSVHFSTQQKWWIL